MKTKYASTPEHILHLLDKPKWARISKAGSPAARVVECHGDFVVKLKSGRFVTSGHVPRNVLRFVGQCHSLTRKYFEGLTRLGCFNTVQESQLRDHFDLTKRHREAEEDLADIERLSKKYDFRAPKRLQRRKETPSCD